ncbi:helix-turn-helix domain-containing protein [Serratia sp. AKBS12]|uniref:helix-turn-helix domain-containing protein n=1 Tax=Serratia sp. AKBS12 TaxID=2974597 RepID=UPI00216608AB|nr:helix-turn-helix domain-containing protein [Serratia sp. AKBS12]MCS3407317.1 helix-turn-helix domain-containing protein [Serratia sp. AKBS12]HEI8868450.1 helix-turn-helix domain-containing protein [Serratia odorifera]
MALHSVTEAAKLVGVTRRTIYRHIASNKLLVAEGQGDNIKIDTGELLRVYQLPAQQLTPNCMAILLEKLLLMQQDITMLILAVNEIKGALYTRVPAEKERGLLDWLKKTKRHGV